MSQKKKINVKEVIEAHDMYLPRNPQFEEDLYLVSKHLGLLEEEE